jgi:orotidine-5'-phosphate decarboxylase
VLKERIRSLEAENEALRANTRDSVVVAMDTNTEANVAETEIQQLKVCRTLDTDRHLIKANTMIHQPKVCCGLDTNNESDVVDTEIQQAQGRLWSGYEY